MMHKLLITLIFLLFISQLSIAQVSLGGTPASFKANTALSDIPLITMPSIDLARLRAEDEILDQDDGLYRFAHPFPVNYDMANTGKWENLRNGQRIWRLQITAPNAHNMNLIFNDFHLPKGGLLYIYNEDRTQVLGAFSEHNNKVSKNFATELIYDDFLTLEYVESPKTIGKPTFRIVQIAHGYRSLDRDENQAAYRIDESGNCQVNVNCSEGNGIWQDHKKGVARMVINGSGLCSGSLLNNTSGDCTPYFLTADHCIDGTFDAVTAPNANIVFYWNYERAGCADTGSAPLNQTSSGATVIANDGPSDFALLRIEGQNPNDIYDVYFNGWDRSGDTGTGGKGIHHPAGDIKKISTHSVAPTSAGAYWELFWDATANGHSVTEGGSSGSPLFRTNGRVIGQLFGGSSLNCSDPANDLGRYGKISYSWTNGNNADNRRRLDAWLDPINSGLTTLDGSYDPCAISQILFSSASSTVNEESATVENNCNDYQDHMVTLIIQQVPSINADVTLTNLGGTATAGLDYDIITTGPLTFSLGVLTQNFTIRVYNDGEVEADETIVVGYTLNSNGGDAIAAPSNQTHTITITDEDIAPSPIVNTAAVNADFEISMGTFTTENASLLGGTFVQGNTTDANSGYWSTTGNTSSFSFANDDACNCDMSDVKLISPSVDLSGLTTASLSFDHAFSDVGAETAAVLISTDGGATWSAPVLNLTNTSIDNGGSVYETPWQTGLTLDLATYIGQTDVKIAFIYNDGGDWAYGMAIDNVVLSTSKPMNVQTAIVSTEEHLSPNATVHFYNPTTGNILCTIENTSAHDYGCTTVEVDRTGTSFLNIGGDNRVLDKQFLVTPTTNNPSGTYNITLYYTAAERNGFINDNDLAYDNLDLNMYKSSSNLSAATTVITATVNESSFASDYSYTASFFSGFSGFGIGAGVSPLPVELLSFTGKNIDVRTNHLAWATASEINSDYFQIERSIDGKDFEKIGKIKAAGNTTEEIRYTFDDKTFNGSENYYRLKIVDQDATFEYSDIVFISSDTKETSILVSPNPSKGIFNFNLGSDLVSNQIQINVFNVNGQLVHQKMVTNEAQSFNLDLSHLSEGIFICQVNTGNETITKRLIVK